jgi:hypothetical protein
MWIYVIVVALLIFGIYAFLAITDVQMRWLSRRSNKPPKASTKITAIRTASSAGMPGSTARRGQTQRAARLTVRNISRGDSVRTIRHVARCGRLSIPAGSGTGSLRLRPRHESGAGGTA